MNDETLLMLVVILAVWGAELASKGNKFFIVPAGILIGIILFYTTK